MSLHFSTYRKQSQYFKIFVSLILAIMTTLALGVNYTIASWDTAAQAVGSQNSILVSLVKLRQNFNLYTIQWQIIAALLWVVYYKLERAYSLSAREVIAALIFGAVNVISNSLVVNGNWGFVFANTYQVVVSSICIVGQAALLLSVVKILFMALDRVPSWARENMEAKSRGGLGRLFRKYPWRFSFAFMLLCWLPDLIIAYPAQLTNDGVNQLQQWLQIIPRTTAHPFLATVIIGTLFNVGNLFGNDNFSIFFLALSQSCIMAACFSAVVKKIQRMDIPTSVSIAAMVFYGLHPMMGEYAHTLVKDSISMPVFTLFILEAALFSVDPECYAQRWQNFFRLTLWGTVSCLLRHNYGYAVFPTFIAILIVSQWKIKSKHVFKSMVVCTMACAICVQGVNFLGPRAMNYQDPYEWPPLLFIPVQQTARYVRDHTDDVTSEERAAISAVLDYDKLAERYNPNSADPVKATYHGDESSIKQYLKVWKDMLFKHPETYIQAAIHGSHSYYAFTPYVGVRTMSDILRRDSVYLYNVERLGMELSHPELLEPVLTAWENTKELFVRSPILGLLCNCAFYTWLLLLVGLYFVRKREWKLWLLLVPMAFMILSCMTSPVNGNWRYYVPVVASTPIIAAISIRLLAHPTVK